MRERSDIYLTHVQKLLQIIERFEMFQRPELSVGIVAFIHCRLELR